MINIGNQRLQKKINRELIIAQLRQSGELSRSRIAELTGLGWGSVTKYTGELLRENMIVEVRAEKSGGRNSVILGLNQDYKYIAGIDIGAGFMKAVVVDMSGAVRASHREATKWDCEKAVVLAQINDMIVKVLDEAGISSAQLLAIGCGISGGVDFSTGFLKRTGNFSDFKQVPLAGILQERFGVPCFLSNSIIIRLLGISKSPLIRHCRNVAYVWLGTGVGAGIISDGRIVVPTEDRPIGDIAHYMIRRDGVRCYCGLHGCLETVVGARHLLKRIRERSGRVFSDDDVTAWREIREAAAKGETGVCGILAEAGRDIATVIEGIIQFNRPELIILDGGMTHLGEPLVRPIRNAVGERFPQERFDAANIIAAGPENYCGALGATLFAWDNVFHSEREYVNLQLHGTYKNKRTKEEYINENEPMPAR